MRVQRDTLLPALVALAVISAGCTAAKSEDQKRIDELLESFNGKDPLVGLNATMEVKEATATEGRCVGHAEETTIVCHTFRITVVSVQKHTYVVSNLAFEGVLENGVRIRAVAIYGSSTIVEGSQNITVTFETTTGHHVTSVRIGYKASYTSTTVSSYETMAPTHVNVVFTVRNATIARGNCFNGATNTDLECHRLEVRVDNTAGEEIPASCFYWSGTTNRGTMDRCIDSTAQAIIRGANATLQLSFEARAQSGDRFVLLEYRASFLGLYGNATVPGYTTDL